MSNRVKVALITGAARRIGASIATTLHQAGMQVVLHYHHSEVQAKALCDALNHQRAQSASLLKADLSDMTQLDHVIKQAVEAWGQLDVLINNASQFFKTHLGQVTEKNWHELMDSNLKAPFFLSQAAAAYLQKTKGCIVNITDVHGVRPMRDYGVYCISKAGLLMATQVLAKELGPDIRVNAVSPGAILWPEGENTLDEKDKTQIINRVALARPGSPDDIAKAVLFLVQNADYITGEVINVDGGRSLLI